MVVYIALIISLLYSIFVFYVYFNLKKKNHYKDCSEKEKISLIVPFKNEEQNLANLCVSLNNQSLDNDFFEVIFVDDLSDDKSISVIEKNILIKNYKIIKNHGKRKKDAIKSGVRTAKNNIIVTTDADCVVNKNWLLTISSFFACNSDVKMAIMPVVYENYHNFFEKIQSLEFSSLAAVTAGTALAGKPIMCNGANLAYRKNIFSRFQNELKQEVDSGDDVFLMFAIKKYYQKNIRYLKNENVIVGTKPTKTLKEFINQRLRWAAKSKFYTDFFTLFSGSLILSINFLLLFLLFTGFWKLFFISLIIKSLSDFVLISNFLKFTNQKDLLVFFPIVQIIYPFYAVFIPLCSLVCKYKWK